MMNQAITEAKGEPVTSLLQRKPNLNRHLPMRDFAVFDVAAGFLDLEPSHIPHSFGSAGYGGFYGVLDAVGGRADQFDLFVYVVAHGKSLLRLGEWGNRNLPCRFG